MAYRYTGQADAITVHGKTYARDEQDYIRQYGKAPDATYDKPIVGLSKAEALHMISYGNLHSFEDDGGDDLLEKTTTPDPHLMAPPSIVEAKK